MSEWDAIRRRANAVFDAWDMDGQWIQPETVVPLLDRLETLEWLLAEARWWAGELRFQHVEMLDREPFPWEVM